MFYRLRWLVAIVASAFLASAVVTWGNYTATQGAGTTFGSNVVSTIHYPQANISDPTTPSQMAAVSSAGALSTQLVAETTKVIGTVRNLGNAGAIFDGATGAAVPANVLYLGMNNSGNLLGLIGDNTNGLWVNVKNANANGQATMANSSPVVIASNQSAVPITATPSTSGQLTNYFVQPTASDNHANIKNGAGVVYSVSATNNSATVNYLRLYNAATGFNGCNSATNLVAQWAIPASTSGAGIVVPINPFGITFSTGISICVTSGYATTDTTNATASAMSVNVGYN